MKGIGLAAFVLLLAAATGCVRHGYDLDLIAELAAPLPPQHVPPAPAPPVRQTPPAAIPSLRERVLVEKLQPFPPHGNPCTELSQQLAHAYMHFRYDEALELAALLVSHPGATDAQRIHAYVLAAAAHYLQGRREHARACIRKAAGVSPKIRLSENAFPAAMRAFFQAEIEAAWRR